MIINADLGRNATSNRLGCLACATPDPADGLCAYDLVYNPLQTRLLRRARARVRKQPTAWECWSVRQCLHFNAGQDRSPSFERMLKELSRQFTMDRNHLILFKLGELKSNMKPKARRMQDLTPQFFAALGEKISALRASGVDVINLDIGSPDMPPAAHIVGALVDTAHQPGVHGYQSHRGIDALRQAWATYYQREYKIDLDPERQILQVLGSKEGIFHLSTALVDEGDIVLIPDPGYVTYTHGALFAGGTPVYLPLQAQNDWLPDLDDNPEDILRRVKILWLNYPNNPTAATASMRFL